MITATATRPAYLDAPASAGRIDFLRTLLAERVVPADAAARLTARIEAGAVSTDQAIIAINWLKAQPKVAQAAKAPARAAVDADAVPAGRYAVATEAGAVNTLAFYKVDRPTEGKWAGYVFVKLMRSDEEQRLSRAAANAVLAKIAAVGAKEASAAYGREIGSCGVCGRTLTNDESREIGIGPDCRANMGW